MKTTLRLTEKSKPTLRLSPRHTEMKKVDLRNVASKNNSKKKA